MADTPKFQTLDPQQLSIAVGFLMSRLPEGDLAELDAMLDGDTAQVAADAALKRPDALAWATMRSDARHAVRQSRQRDRAQRAADMASTHERFPHMNRLG